MQIWQRLRPLRQRTGRTASEVADEINVGAPYLSRMERGEVGMRVETLESYLAALGHRLTIADGVDPSIGELADAIPPDRRQLALELLEVIPSLPDGAIETLQGMVRHWRAIYGTIARS